MRSFLVLNGPNLNLLGRRDPAVYGSTTHADLIEACTRHAADLDATVEVVQSNHEGTLIDLLHGATADGIVLNAGAYAHTSYAVRDAIDAIDIPVVEVHISNVMEREDWRRVSVIKPVCAYSIYGRGIDGYRWAMRHLVARATPRVQLAYGDSPEQFGDLRLPASGNTIGLAVLVHGGFWAHQWTADTMEFCALDLGQRGIATFNVEYRRIGAGGDASSMVADVLAATQMARGHVGSERLALIGHSAGAQLAFRAALSLEPELTVAMGGILDMESALADSIGSGAAAAYLDGAAAIEFSPAAAPLASPTIIAHGDSDDRVPFVQALRYLEAASAAGVDQIELMTVKGGGHFEFLDPTRHAWTEVAERVVTALS